MGKPVRQIGFDNIKGILIFLVVFGHFLELCPKDQFTKAVYLLIYSFHMPAFLFISGFFASYCPRRMRYLAVLYGIFQILYCAFSQVVLGFSNAFMLKEVLFTPYWLLWFIPVLLYCHLLLPFWNKAGRPRQLTMLLVSVIVALLSGYCPQIGYPLSLSRFLVFLPFFLAGNLARTYTLRLHIQHILLLVLLACCSSVILCSSKQLNAQMLYGSFSYTIGYNPGIRLGILVHAAIWTGLLFVLARSVLNRPIPILSKIGANTMPVYLLHGFIVKIIGHIFPILPFSTALFCSMIVTALLGNPLTGRLIAPTIRNKK